MNTRMKRQKLLIKWIHLVEKWELSLISSYRQPKKNHTDWPNYRSNLVKKRVICSWAIPIKCVPASQQMTSNNHRKHWPSPLVVQTCWRIHWAALASLEYYGLWQQWRYPQELSPEIMMINHFKVLYQRY